MSSDEHRVSRAASISRTRQGRKISPLAPESDEEKPERRKERGGRILRRRERIRDKAAKQSGKSEEKEKGKGDKDKDKDGDKKKEPVALSRWTSPALVNGFWRCRFRRRTISALSRASQGFCSSSEGAYGHRRYRWTDIDQTIQKFDLEQSGRYR